MQTSIFKNDDSMPVVVKKAVFEALPLFIGTADNSVLSAASIQLAEAFGDQGAFIAII